MKKPITAVTVSLAPNWTYDEGIPVLDGDDLVLANALLVEHMTLFIETTLLNSKLREVRILVVIDHESEQAVNVVGGEDREANDLTDAIWGAHFVIVNLVMRLFRAPGRFPGPKGHHVKGVKEIVDRAIDTLRVARQGGVE